MSKVGLLLRKADALLQRVVITVETYKYYESWSFAHGEQIYGEDGGLLPGKASLLAPGTHKRRWPIDMARSAQLQIYAQALIDVFLSREP